MFVWDCIRTNGHVKASENGFRFNKLPDKDMGNALLVAVPKIIDYRS